MKISVFVVMLVGVFIIESRADKKKVHIKIHLPQIIKTEHHPKIVFVEKQKPMPKEVIIHHPIVKKQEIVHHHHIHHHNHPKTAAAAKLLLPADDFHKKVFHKKQKYQTYNSEYGVRNGNPGYLSKYQKFPVDLIYKNRYADVENGRAHFGELASDFDYHSRGYKVHEDDLYDDELEEEDIGESPHQDILGY